jgi:DNA-binding NtrC family response regulator
MKPESLNKTLLIIDDDKIFCDTIKSYLTKKGLEVFTAHTGVDGISICSHHKIDVVLLDQNLPNGEGHSFCSAILKCNEQSKIIFITAYPSFQGAVKAIKAGAHDYLSKPFELEELSLEIEQAFRTIELEKVEQIHQYKIDKESEEAVLIGSEGGLSDIARLVDLAASSLDAPVLITGETGTGKNVVARAIHYRSVLRKAPFISINCAALPENLIEAELFGYEKGAFTGATMSRRGIFEMAEGGTLFLDEIGEMPLHLQAKLLGAIEDKKIKRIGSESIIPVNVRIIAATCIDLENAVGKTFRKELYYRISVLRIHVPPLRERRQDIHALCQYFLSRISRGRDGKLPDSEIENMMNYDWPGNVRELRNILERAVLLQKGPSIKPSEFLIGVNEQALLKFASSINLDNDIVPLNEIEKTYIRSVLEKLCGNYSKTAKALGISLSTLKRKLHSYGLK